MMRTTTNPDSKTTFEPLREESKEFESADQFNNALNTENQAVKIFSIKF